MESEKSIPERIRHRLKITEDMMLNLMRGKDLTLFFCTDDQEFEFCFRGPYDGMFLTHREISNLQRQAESRMTDIFAKVQDINVQEYVVKEEGEK